MLIFTWSLSYLCFIFYLIFVILACDYGIVLFKVPTAEEKPVPEVPMPTVAPVEQKIISPPKGI